LNRFFNKNYIFSHPVKNKNKNKGSQRFLRSSDCLNILLSEMDIEIQNGEFSLLRRKASHLKTLTKNKLEED
jgi:hypothetical protein